MININGSIWIGGEELFFEDFEITTDEDYSDDAFDLLIDKECGYCECDECEDKYDEEELELHANLDFLVDIYTSVINEECIYEDCVRGTLVRFIGDLMDVLTK